MSLVVRCRIHMEFFTTLLEYSMRVSTSFSFCLSLSLSSVDHKSDYLLKEEETNLSRRRFVHVSLSLSLSLPFVAISIVSVRCLFVFCCTHLDAMVSIIHVQTRVALHRFACFLWVHKSDARSFVLFSSSSSFVDDQKQERDIERVKGTSLTKAKFTIQSLR